MRVSDEELAELVELSEWRDYVGAHERIASALRELQRARVAIETHTIIIDELESETKGTYWAGGYRTALHRIKAAMEAE
jgi:hypothetical protein